MSEPEPQKTEQIPEAKEEPKSITTPAATNRETSLVQKRLLGAFIDILISIGILFLGLKIFPEFLSKLAWALQLGYLLTRDALPFLDGKSLGKMAVGLRAVTTNGESLKGKWEASIIRNVVFAVPFFPLVEVIVLLTRQNPDDPKNGLRLGDDFAKTKVIASQD